MEHDLFLRKAAYICINFRNSLKLCKGDGHFNRANVLRVYNDDRIPCDFFQDMLTYKLIQYDRTCQRVINITNMEKKLLRSITLHRNKKNSYGLLNLEHLSAALSKHHKNSKFEKYQSQTVADTLMQK